jgi:hypothetical protein
VVIDITTEADVFRPVKVNLVFETREELEDLCSRLMVPPKVANEIAIDHGYDFKASSVNIPLRDSLVSALHNN